MKARKLALLAVIFLVAAFSIFPAGIDLVVMVDTSASMFPVFDDLVNYLLRDILENRLRSGDTFHLLSFAGSVEEELSENIAETSDLAAVIGRILLLQPLGHYTDLIGALESLYDYVGGLPGDNRKLVLLLTDGIHDPPPGSPNRLRPEEALERLLANTDRIRREGWEVRILRTPGADGAAAADVPDAGRPETAPAETGSRRETAPAGVGRPETAQSGASGARDSGSEPVAGTEAPPPGTEPPAGQDFLEELAQGLQTDVVEIEEGDSDPTMLSGRLTGSATVSFPGDLGRVTRRVNVPLRITNSSDDLLRLDLAAVERDGRNLLTRSQRSEIQPQSAGEMVVPLRLPASVADGPNRLTVRLVFSDPELRISPLQGDLIFTYVPAGGLATWVRGIPFLYWIYAVAALALIALIVFLIVFLRNRMADASFAGFYGGGRRNRRRGKPIIMRVREQNSQIGSRNIHRAPPKCRLGVGSDGAAFLIYFVQMPRRIGELRNDGSQFVFIPRRTDLFVDLKGPLPDCLGKEIYAVSLRGYPVVFSFHEYVSPLEEINRLMRSIRYESQNSPKS